MADILLVDDSRTNLVQIGRHLERLNVVFDTAMNGKEAIEQIEKNQPKLVLLDIVMPVMDGFEVLKTLRSRSELANTYVIVLTSLTKRNDLVNAIQLGADDYVTKPVDFDTLSQKVSQVFSKLGNGASITPS